MKGSNGQSESGRFHAAANDDLRFFLQAFLALVFWG
jgi:hypothetical protein